MWRGITRTAQYVCGVLVCVSVFMSVCVHSVCIVCWFRKYPAGELVCGLSVLGLALVQDHLHLAPSLLLGKSLISCDLLTQPNIETSFLSPLREKSWFGEQQGKLVWCSCSSWSYIWGKLGVAPLFIYAFNVNKIKRANRKHLPVCVHSAVR